MNVQEMLQLLKKKGEDVKLVMYDDGSGEVVDDVKGILFDFEDLAEFERKLKA